MTTSQLIPALMLMTLFAGLFVGAGQLFAFMQRRHNRMIAENTLLGDGSRHSSGALSEIVAVGVIGIAAMGLLVAGYKYRQPLPATPATATPAASTSAPASSTERMSSPQRERANPADMSSPPTQYPMGSGSATTGGANPSPK